MTAQSGQVADGQVDAAVPSAWGSASIGTSTTSICRRGASACTRSISSGRNTISPMSDMDSVKRRALVAVEAVPQAERVGEGVHALADRPGQREGDGRGLHAGGGAQEQRIVELLAQPRQRVADGGLRQMQPLGARVTLRSCITVRKTRMRFRSKSKRCLSYQSDL